MRLFRSLAVAIVVLSGSAVVLAGTGRPAAAHQHPTPVELVSPAVVRVQTYARVSISLIEHNRAGAHIGLTQRVYTPLLASGSGFAVDPSGGIVTSPDLIDVDLNRAEVYAVNHIFNERYGDAAPLPADPFTTQTIADTGRSDGVAARLRRCYSPNATDDTGGCVVFSERMVKVLPFVTSQKQYGDLDAVVLYPAAGTPVDVAVLKVGASSMPTVDLATSAGDVTAFSLLGFPDTPSGAGSLRNVEGHLAAAGATDVKRDEDYPELIAGMSAGLGGGPVVGERGQVVGFLDQRPAKATQSPSADLGLIGPDTVRAALAASGITPRQGETDAVYENAMHNYKNQLYTPAIPYLSQTLKLYPGHALASEALAEANRKKGTAEDLSGRTDGEPTPEPAAGWRSIAVPIVTAVTVLLVLAAGLFLLSRRRRPDAADGRAAGPGGAATVPRQRPPWEAPTGPAQRPDTETVVQPRSAYHPAAVGSGPFPPAGPSSEADATARLRQGDPRAVGEQGRCARCGNPVAASGMFCEHCGQRLH